MVGGIISDKYEKKGYYRVKSYVCIFAGVMGIPTIAICTLCHKNFWLSISMYALEYLFAESWIGPALTMLVNTVSP